MAASISVIRKATAPTARLLGVGSNSPPVWAPVPGAPRAGGAEGQGKTSADRMGRPGLPKPFILSCQLSALLL